MRKNALRTTKGAELGHAVFTFIELLVVIAVTAVLASLPPPALIPVSMSN